MRHLLNTLFVLNENAYLSLDGENVVIQNGDTELGRFPLHGLEGIICFSYKGASPAFMGACAKRGVGLCFMTRTGRFLARCTGEIRGNVLLRKAQFHISENEVDSLKIAKNFIIGKLHNCRWVLERATRDHPLSIDLERVKSASSEIKSAIIKAHDADCIASLRGIEGDAASIYYGSFNELILRNTEDFQYTSRSRRPPLDNVNAMLSFIYTVLANDCAAALESVGLDPYIGFMHTDRPGRVSLALDLMEELRSVLADRFVISCINNRVVSAEMFEHTENGAVIMTDKGRRAFIAAWQDKKRESLKHPFLGEKIPWGLVPYVQSLLLARHLRGDIDEYPPFLWK